MAGKYFTAAADKRQTQKVAKRGTKSEREKKKSLCHLPFAHFPLHSQRCKSLRVGVRRGWNSIQSHDKLSSIFFFSSFYSPHFPFILCYVVRGDFQRNLRELKILSREKRKWLFFFFSTFLCRDSAFWLQKKNFFISQGNLKNWKISTKQHEERFQLWDGLKRRRGAFFWREEM